MAPQILSVFRRPHEGNILFDRANVQTPLSADQLAEGIIAVLRNAEELLDEAQLLLEHGRAARAYALAFEAREEIAKAPMLSTTIYKLFFKAPIDWPLLGKRLRNHLPKAFMSEEIGLRVNALEAKDRYLRSAVPGQVLDANILFPMTSAKQSTAHSRSELRAKAINCDFNGKTFKQPSDIINSQDACDAVTIGKAQLDYATKLFAPSSVESVRASIASGIKRCEEFATLAETAKAAGVTLPPLIQELANLKSSLLRSRGAKP